MYIVSGIDTNKYTIGKCENSIPFIANDCITSESS
jgi:hypothetical protein